MSVKIDFKREETFTFDELTFVSTGKKIKQIKISQMTYADRRTMLNSLPTEPGPNDLYAAMFDLVVRKTNLTETEVSELPEPIYNAIVNFLNPSA